MTPSKEPRASASGDASSSPDQSNCPKTISRRQHSKPRRFEMSITMHTGPNTAPPAVSLSCNEAAHPLLRRPRLSDFLRHVPLRGRLRLGICRTQDRRYRFGVLADDGLAGQFGADVDLRRAAQRHGAAGLQEAVHALRLACDRTLDLCAAGESVADTAVLAMAADAVGGLEHRRPCSRRRRDRGRLPGLAHRALQHLPDQPFRAVRIDASRLAFRRPHGRADEVQDAGPVSPDPAPDLSRLHHCLLVRRRR